ncbi:NAD(P)/FAD-dependent oxidoreductase [Candidimonas sp. SYP-B2681]|uniref:NAD(P)/FAD-dependent oxidoreductase n=1 Tax=Candidimonas sp. SYP-B2681 TaxID=2497686 RepID=UPI000F88F167|nr:NAD(P)/FAD-dependent oxidoreductase [Candidimonas sp. SYP-B2681]RTZ45736.1 NAD(P)/FAD-dependent oxidoreductase [Candidimonas sp. SYP-B2681]
MNVEGRVFDALIIGGGPAGVSCAVWLARLGFSAMLLEARGQVGGLCLDHPFLDEWNASLPGMTGPQVAENLAVSLHQAVVPVRLSCPVYRLELAEYGFDVAASGLDGPLRTRHIVLATGVRARSLPDAQANADANQQLDASAATLPPGILVGPGAHIVAQEFHGKRVAVLGGGDNAFENAIYALEHGAKSVRIFARSIKAQQQFVRKVPPDSVVTGSYEVIAAQRNINGEPYDLILVFYGWEPCVGFADGLGLHRSTRGFIATDMQTAQTSCPGVYAIGEVAQRQHPCVVTALADGVTAAKAIQARIEAGY